jgi:hypothetical protein
MRFALTALASKPVGAVGAMVSEGFAGALGSVFAPLPQPCNTKAMLDTP